MKMISLASVALVLAGSVASAQSVELNIDLFGGSANDAVRGSVVVNAADVDDLTRVESGGLLPYSTFSGVIELGTQQTVGVRQNALSAQDVMTVDMNGTAVISGAPVLAGVEIAGQNDVLVSATGGRNDIDLFSSIDSTGEVFGLDTPFGGVGAEEGDVTNNTELSAVNVARGPSGTLQVSVTNTGSVTED